MKTTNRLFFFVLVAIAPLMLPVCSAIAVAIERQVYDCSLPAAQGDCVIDLLWSGGFTWGRSEGEPPRGPNPNNGSTDVDFLYEDAIPTIMQYYDEKFDRNGPNGRGGTGDGTASWPVDYFVVAANTEFGDFGSLCPSNGAWSNDFAISFCGGTRYESADLYGHEAFHITTFNMRHNPDGSPISLVYQDESGALNEGMSDFFGESFEFWKTGSMDWMIDAPDPTSTWFRDFADPPAGINDPPELPYPDRYLSPDYYTGTEDVGGVHTNSSILNKASYLAVEGGTFNGYVVEGIGLEKVEQIWYRAVTEYFDPNETFNMAYAHIIQAASDLYGPTEVAEVTKALQAVEMNLTRSPSPGDFDSDGDVDGGDFLAWQRGESPQPLSSFDLAAWELNFGENLSPAVAAVVSTPEPSSLLLTSLAGLLFCSRRRRV